MLVEVEGSKVRKKLMACEKITKATEPAMKFNEGLLPEVTGAETFNVKMKLCSQGIPRELTFLEGVLQVLNCLELQKSAFDACRRD